MIDPENAQSGGENMDNIDTLPMDVESVDEYLSKETYICIHRYDIDIFMYAYSMLSCVCKSFSYRKQSWDLWDLPRLH